MSLSLKSALNALPLPLHALVVGGTSGIGLGVAQQICTDVNAHVTIAGRNAAVAQQILLECPNKNMKFRRVDASLMENVKVFCSELSQELKAEHNMLELVVLCQGIISAKVEPTIENIDVALALNYYSRMLIIRELIKLDALSSDAIIVSVLNAKFGDTSGNSILWDDMDISRGIYGIFSIKKILKHNLSMQDIMLQHLAEGSTRTFIHNFPGFVTTNILENAHLPGFVKWFMSRNQGSEKYVTSVYAGEKIIVGAVEAWQKTKATGQSWFCTDDKGFEIKKPDSPEDVRRRVAEHTWALVDAASEGRVGNTKRIGS